MWGLIMEKIIDGKAVATLIKEKIKIAPWISKYNS